MKIILQIASFALLLGHGWQHLSKGGPYRSFLLDDFLMQGFAESLGYNWADLLQNTEVDANILLLGKGIGIFFLIAALVALAIQWIPKWISWILLGGSSFFLLFMAICLAIDKGWILVQGLEYMAQISTPLLLCFYHHKNVHPPKLVNILKVVIAFTFVCHGLFAMGVYPIPGHFVDMVIYGFGVSETVAKQVLLVAGILDIVAAILLFLPKKGVVYTALVYMAFWGFLTTIARVVTTYQVDLGWYSLKQWLPEVLFRFPHFLLPIAAIVLMYQWNNRHRNIGL